MTAMTAMTPTIGQLNLCLQRGNILYRLTEGSADGSI
jgi:hypothetical protein